MGAGYSAASCPAGYSNYERHTFLSILCNIVPFVGPAIDGAFVPTPPNMQPVLDQYTANLNVLTSNWQQNITKEVYKLDVNLNNLLQTIMGDGSDGTDYAAVTAAYVGQKTKEDVMLLEVNVFFLGIVISMIIWYLIQNKTSA
jgi:hypothetical protein